jgi:cyclase
MKASGKFCVAVAALALSALAGAAQAQRALPIVMHTIEPGKIYWAEGGGGNSGIIIGDKGVTIIDAKIDEEAGRALVAEVRKLTPKPITYLVETHSDGDHVNGVAAFPRGVKIIAHANNRDEQIAMQLQALVEVNGGVCLAPKDRLPDMVIYKDKVSATLNSDRMVFQHFGNAHTTGDIAVYLPDHKLVFAGDILTYNVLIHPEKGGSLDGWFENAKGLIAIGAKDYVPGHGKTLDTTADIQKRADDYRTSRQKVAAMVDQGKSLADIKIAMNDPPKDSIGCRGVPYPSLTWVEYYDRVGRAAELK